MEIKITEKEYQDWSIRFKAMTEMERLDNVMSVSNQLLSAPNNSGAQGVAKSMKYCVTRFINENS